MFEFATIPKYCVNLARRTDRRAAMEAEFDRHQLQVKFVTAIDGRAITMPELSRKKEYYAAANWACLQSHIGIIRRAVSEYICVFEDDVKLCDDFTQRAGTIDCDFDIFYLGGGCELKDGLQRVSEMRGTWAYIMRDTVYDYAIRNATYNWGPDEYFSEVLLRRFNGYAQIPMMVAPMGGDSDIGGPTPAQ